MSGQRAWLVVIAGALLGACASDPETIERTAVERGQALFADPRMSQNEFNPFACSTCHATSAHPAGERRLPGADLDGVVSRPTFWGNQENDLLRSVDNCLRLFMRENVALDRSSARASDLYAFLASLPATRTGPAPFSVVASIQDVPVGDAARGADLYARACLDCHGAAHTGEGRLLGASVLPEETIAEHSQYGPLELRLTAIEKIRHGSFLGYAGRMPPFSSESLSDAEVGDILSYLGFLPP